MRGRADVPGHILTGPVAVRAPSPASAGSRDPRSKLRQDWGYNLIRPLAGTLPDDFHETRLITSRSRRSGWWAGCRGGSACRWGRSSASWAWPAAGLGPHHLADPPRDGGNLDNKELIPAPSSICRCSCRAPVLLRRRPRRAGRRRGLRHRDRDRAAGTFKLTLRKDLASIIPAPRR